MIAPVYARVGQTITLEGYADDFGSHIVAIEFSLDGGTTWERHSTETARCTGRSNGHLRKKAPIR